MENLDQQNQTYEYLPSIDALRFVSFILILINHSNINKSFQWHNFFFTLTGFLITYVTASRIKKDQKFSFRRYLARRFLRTLPLFYLVVFICFGIAGLSKFLFNEQITTGKLWPFLFLVQNYFDQNILFALSNLWAIAVTEQYYLLLGVFSIFFYRHLKVFGLFLIVIGIIINIISYSVFDRYNYFYTYHYLSNFGVGSVLGFFCFERKVSFFIFSQAKKLYVYVYMSFAFLLIIFTLLVSPKWIYPYSSFFLSISYCLIVFNIAFAKNKILNLNKFKWMQYLGKRTLSMYYLHAPVMIVLSKTSLVFGWKIEIPLYFFITLMFTIGLSILSYRYFESYFLRLKNTF